MSKIIRVRYENGVLKPLEPIEFNEGEELILEVKNVHHVRGIRKFFGIIKAKKHRTRKKEDYYEYLSERAHIS